MGEITYDHFVSAGELRERPYFPRLKTNGKFNGPCVHVPASSSP
jgi:hypothetical protein